MKILAVTYCFVPLQFPATFRLLKWCTALTELGHEITIVAVHPDSFVGPKEQSLEALIPDGVEVVFVRSPENSLVYRALHKAYRWTYPYFEPRKKEWLRAATRATLALQPSRYDLLFTCSQPPVSHLVGLEVAARTGLPWVAFFSDPWVENPMATGISKNVLRYNSSLERQVVERSQRLVLPSPELIDHLVSRYQANESRKMLVLPHSFVPQWYDLANPPLKVATDMVHIVCTGNFYHTRTPVPLIEALLELRRRNLRRGLRIDMYGQMDPRYENMLQSDDLGKLVKFHGRIGYLESLSKMRQADFLLLIDAPLGKAKQGVFLPSKLVDYLGAQRPILGMTPLEGTAARVLQETGNVVCDLYSPKTLTDALTRVLDGGLSPALRPEAIAQYNYQRVGQRLVQIFRDAKDGMS